MTTQKFNEERTFGIEIEFTTASRETVARLMKQKGLLAEVEGYNHFTRRHWKLITDSSCGYELVSPILKGRDGLNQLKLATEASAEAGAKVNRRCGLHIHHDINDLDAKQVANIYALCIKLEKTIDSFLPKSRRADNNEYCRSLFRHSNQQRVLDQLKTVNTMEDINDIFRTRYLKLNFQSYVKYGTIEFRQHSGTIDFEKMYNWILLTQRIVERAKERNVTYSYKESSVPVLTFQKMLGIINSVGADEEIAKMNTFYLKRMKELAA